ncbi:ABC transporter substrate-binding protein [Methylacidiphilum fumariolicum]|nr:ABC transporter substrate-binding protein [Candidatus Methylacidiphilum fumarolicum]
MNQLNYLDYSVGRLLEPCPTWRQRECLGPMFALLLVTLTCLPLLQGQASGSSNSLNGSWKEAVDTEGHLLHVPQPVERIVTLGPVPVLNSLIFVLGVGRKIVSGLPPWARSPLWRWQGILAPQILNAPPLQSVENRPNLETLLALHPDLVVASPEIAKALEACKLPVFSLKLRSREDLPKAVRLLGVAVGAEEQASSYVSYWERIDRIVSRVVAEIPREQRPRVLYCSLRSLSTPHRIVDRWIEDAGGQSLTAGDRPSEEYRFSIEQLLVWNPDILIVEEPEEIELARKDARFASLSAVRRRRVLCMPMGVHRWGRRTVEEPLALLWAAQQFHPDQFHEYDLRSETREFYRRFFGYPLSEAEADTILRKKISEK